MLIRIKKQEIIFYFVMIYILLKYPLGLLFSNVIHRAVQIFIYLSFFYTIIIKRIYKKLSSTVVLFFISNYLYVIVQGLLYGNTQRFQIGIKTYVLYSLVFFVSMYLYRYIDIEKFISLFIGYGVLNSIVSILEFYTKKSVITGESLKHYINGGVLVRTLGLNGNYFICAVILGLCSLFAFYRLQKKINFFNISTFFILIFGVLSTQSRGPLVGTVVALVYLYLVKGENNSYISKKIVRFIGIVIIISVFIIWVLNTDLDISNTTINTFLIRIRQIFDWRGETANVERIQRWNKALVWMSEKPLFGHGIGSTGSDVASMGVTESGILQRIVDLGIVGTFFNIGMIISVMCKYKKDSKIKNINPYCKIFSAAILLIIVEDFILQIFASMDIMLLFWIFMGFLVAEGSGNQN